ncbi:hypothetical protein [Thermotoga sp.]|uniref:hypothetical protein n=1 Tax=Thermotoga sp. TaxID=28240 RepID=UPI0025EA2CFE|nr:hypothetical protein [Thermotoga sp.]MCD6551372.1 hypothetical protein [Thermotoga sp.]
MLRLLTLTTMVKHSFFIMSDAVGINRYKISYEKMGGEAMRKFCFLFVLGILMITTAITVFGDSSFGGFKILNPEFENEDLKAVFSIKRMDALSVRIYNKTNRIVAVHWGQCLITDNNGRAVKAYSLLNEYSRILIPPQGYIDDNIVPVTHIRFSSKYSYSKDNIEYIEPLSSERLERYFLIVYEVGGNRKSLSGIIRLSYTPPEPGAVLVGLGALLTLLVLLGLLSRGL